MSTRVDQYGRTRLTLQQREEGDQRFLFQPSEVASEFRGHECQVTTVNLGGFSNIFKSEKQKFN